MNTVRDQIRSLSPVPRWAVGAMISWALLLCPACRVTHTAPPTTAGVGDESLLRRANDALLERIRVEQEHVDYYSRELSSLRVEERRLSAEFVQKEAEYQLLASDRDGQIQEAAEAQAEYQAALNSKVELEGLLAGVRQETAALEQERADLQATMASQRAAMEEGELRLANGAARLAEISARELALEGELSAARLQVDAQSEELLVVQAELAQLKRSLLEGQGTRQWLRSSLLASLFMSSLGREGKVSAAGADGGGSLPVSGAAAVGPAPAAGGQPEGGRGGAEEGSEPVLGDPGQAEAEAGAAEGEGGSEPFPG